MTNINLTYLLLAATLVETITVIFVYFKKNQGKYIAKWYNNFRIGAFFMDVLSAMAPVLFALFMNNNFILQSFIIILIELAHDLTFGYFISKYKGKSKILNVFKGYGKEGKFSILFYDQLILISTLIFYYLFDYLKLNNYIYILTGFILFYIALMFIYSF